MLWGAKVKNDGQGGTTEVGEVRVGGSTYGHGLKLVVSLRMQMAMFWVLMIQK